MKLKKICLVLVLFLVLLLPNKVFADTPKLTYRAHVADYGWLSWVNESALAGTTGQYRRMEAINIKLSGFEGGITYQAHVADYGWLNWVNNGELAGTTGQYRRMEAIKIKLTGKVAEYYDIYYRAHGQDYGWQGWVKNGELAGTTGQYRRMEGIEIKLVQKENVTLPDENQEENNEQTGVSYATYSNNNWLSYVSNGEISGIESSEAPIKGLKVKLIGIDSNNIQYQTYSNNKWSGYVTGDNQSGNLSNGIEAIQIKLTNSAADKYDIYYRVKVEEKGWLGWTKNNEISGTIGYFLNVENVQVKLLPKNSSELNVEENAYLLSNNTLTYRVHGADYGWQDWVKDSETGGTTGQYRRMEGIMMNVDSQIGGIAYASISKNTPWQDFVENGAFSGTASQWRQMEAIKIKLTGRLADYYDVYYRVHTEDFGWLDWTKNGEIAGTDGITKRMEAIQVKLVLKGTTFNGNTSKPYIHGTWKNNKYYDYYGNVATGFKRIEGTKYYFNDEGTMIGKNVKKVIDVSSWQNTIDWVSLQRSHDVDAVILRVGWGMSYDDPAGTDSRFDYNIKEVQRLGIPYSVYIYGYAECEHAAKKEAAFMNEMMSKYNIPKDTFVWYDAEESSISRDTYAQVIPIFANQMKEYGYNNVGVYGSLFNFIKDYGNLNSTEVRSYPLWVAQYYNKIQYPGEYRGWQYTSDGSITGINGRVDVNMFY